MVTTQWGEVSMTVRPDDAGTIELMLDGAEYTFRANLNSLLAFRLGQALIKVARQLGLPDGMVDTEV